jgi:glycosyltransferase involved in cell wall biosynthesis
LLECALAEIQMRPLDQAPLLSIVIPSFNRPAELMLAITGIADQLNGGLESKVELIVSDNGSNEETAAAIRHVAGQYQTVSFLRHARDEGGYFNYFAAPWRARGRYTWVFGSDDVLLPGGVAHAVEILERERPSFATLNKRAYNQDLTKEIWPAANSVPDRRFDRFEDLMCALGINQLAFISGNIELTEAARAIDARAFLKMDTRHPHVVAFLAKHHGARAFYASTAHLVHRLENSTLPHYHTGNFYDYAATLPIQLHEVLTRIGAPADFFDRMTGDKRIQTYEVSGPTFVDNIFENFMRCLGGGRYLTGSQRYALEQILTGCRPERLKQFAEIWDMRRQVEELEQQADQAKATLDATRQACLNASRNFTRQ